MIISRISANYHMLHLDQYFYDYINIQYLLLCKHKWVGYIFWKTFVVCFQLSLQQRLPLLPSRHSREISYSSYRLLIFVFFLDVIIFQYRACFPSRYERQNYFGRLMVSQLICLVLLLPLCFYFFNLGSASLHILRKDTHSVPYYSKLLC